VDRDGKMWTEVERCGQGGAKYNSKFFFLNTRCT
jgi:hypothetical protein